MKAKNTLFKVVGVLTLVLVANLIQAQQVPLYSQYYFNKFLYNPSYTGTNGSTEGYMFGRKQYVNVDGYQTSGLTLSGAANDGKVGLGLYYINDVNNIQQTNSVYGSYAYHVKFNELTRLSFGFALGVLKNQFNLNNIVTTDPNDPILRLLDKPAGAMIDAAVGANFEINGLNIGVSVPQMLSNAQKFSDHYNNTVTYDLQSHLIVQASYDIKVNDELLIQPLILFKNTSNSPSQVDLNIMADWMNKGWLGFGIRDGYGVSFMGGLKIAERIKLGYCYDASTGQYSTALGGSHELLLGISLGSKKAPKPDPSLEMERLAAQKKQREQEAKIKELEKQMADIKNKPGTKDTVYVVEKRIVTQKPTETVTTTPTTPSTTQPTKEITNKTIGEFLVIAGSFTDEKNATIYFNQLVNKGLSPYMYFDKGTKVYYVHMGKFYFKEDAKTYMDKNSTGALKLWVKTIK